LILLNTVDVLKRHETGVAKRKDTILVFTIPKP